VESAGPRAGTGCGEPTRARSSGKPLWCRIGVPLQNRQALQGRIMRRCGPTRHRGKVQRQRPPHRRHLGHRPPCLVYGRGSEGPVRTATTWQGRGTGSTPPASTPAASHRHQPRNALRRSSSSGDRSAGSLQLARDAGALELFQLRDVVVERADGDAGDLDEGGDAVGRVGQHGAGRADEVLVDDGGAPSRTAAGAFGVGEAAVAVGGGAQGVGPVGGEPFARCRRGGAGERAAGRVPSLAHRRNDHFVGQVGAFTGPVPSP
jgi:hypothetical protein